MATAQRWVAFCSAVCASAENAAIDQLEMSDDKLKALAAELVDQLKREVTRRSTPSTRSSCC